MKKKAISPVVATILLLGITIIAVSGFSIWFTQYSSVSYVNTQSQISTLDLIEISAITQDYIYIISNSEENITLNNSISINNQRCDIEANLSKGMNAIYAVECLSNASNSVVDVVLILENNLVEKKFANPKFRTPVSSQSSSIPLLSSCKEILDGGYSTGSGVYTIRINGTTFDAYCNMVADGGGWTLIGSKINNSIHVWTYNNRSLLWNNITFGNPNNAFSFDFKSPAWFLLNADEVMLMNADNFDQWITFDTMLNNETMMQEMYAFPRLEVESLYSVFRNNSVTFDCGLRTYGYSSAGSCSTGRKSFGFHALKLYPEYGFNTCNYADFEAGDMWICVDQIGPDCCGVPLDEQREFSAYFENEAVFVR